MGNTQRGVGRETRLTQHFRGSSYHSVGIIIFVDVIDMKGVLLTQDEFGVGAGEREGWVGQGNRADQM